MSIFEKRNSLPADCNHGLLARFQICRDGPREYGLLLLLDTAVQRVLSELRTEKELGYVVMCFVRREHGVLYWNILVQTDRRLELAESLVSEFMRVSAASALAAETSETFAKVCDGVISFLRQPYASLYEQTEAHFKAIELQGFDFDRRLQTAKLLEEGAFSLSDLRAFFERHIAPGGAKRRVLLTRVWAGDKSTPKSALALAELQQPAPAFQQDDANVIHIASLGEWKRTRPLNPGVPAAAKL
jgi:secreted Zn-dependent insulinase-like peptidase